MSNTAYSFDIDDPGMVPDLYLREIVYASAQERTEHEFVDFDDRGVVACGVDRWRILEKIIPAAVAQKYPQWRVSEARPCVIHIHARLQIVQQDRRMVTKWYIATPEETHRCMST